MKRHLLTLFVASLIVACTDTTSEMSPPQGLTAEDEAAIRALSSEWEAAWVADDMAAVTALLTEDYFEARVDAVEGRDAALALYQTFPVTYTVVSGTIHRIEGSGNVANVTLSFEGEYTTDEGVERIQTGNTLWALRKDDAGQWRFSAAGWSASSRDAP